MFLDRMSCMFFRSGAWNFFLGLAELFFSSLKDRWKHITFSAPLVWTENKEVLWSSERHGEGFLLERDDGRSSADVSRHRVQDLHGVLQLQLLIQRHDTGLGPVVSNQDPPQDSIVELHKPDMVSKEITLIRVDNNVTMSPSATVLTTVEYNTKELIRLWLHTHYLLTGQTPGCFLCFHGICWQYEWYRISPCFSFKVLTLNYNLKVAYQTKSGRI